ncbi:polyadenylate-binding -interacting 5-like [Olea europaea subsp. europaea]|nr:polyadenylate-binding -interacting 5-like [Olea europaea subsp. europaea]
MKPGTSKLNPNATSYIPFSERGTVDKGEDFEFSTKESNCGNEAIWFGDQSKDALTHCQPQNVSQSYIQCTDILQTAELSKLKDHCGGELYASSSHNQNTMAEKFTLEEEFDMDITYLQMKFPGISKDSLSEVYSTSNCDVESAVDMLNQLELSPVDLSEKLPEYLDIGDVPESLSYCELPSQKLKNVTGEAGASTSGSSNLDIA